MDYQQLNDIDVVSFDIYDTLIKRTVDNPRDIFDIVQFKFTKNYGAKERNFKKKRITAEKIARKNRKSDDITLDDIYNEIYIDEKYRNIFKNIEIQIEKQICVPNLIYINYLKELAFHKRIVITSDMYLPKEIIVEILSNCGITENLYERLYVSGEIGLAKYTGRIFDFILEDLQVDPSKILHIGDNYNNDVLFPKQKGMSSVEVKNEKSNIEYNNYIKSEKDISTNHILKLVDYTINKDNNKSYNVGFSTFGPVIYSFCSWLNKIVSKNNYDTIVFLSREGFMLKKAYDSLYTGLQTSYIGINRNTLFMPMMYLDPTIDGFFENIPLLKTKYRLDELVKYLDNTIEVEVLIKDYNLSLDIQYSKEDLMNNNDFLLLFELLISKNRDKNYKQYNLLIKYLKENIYGKKVAIVNNSISASAQKKLIKIFEVSNCKYELTSIHFIRKNDNSLKKLNSQVWFNKDCSQHEKMMFYRNCIVFEKILFPLEGTALFYKHSYDGVVVVKESNNYEILNRDILEDIQAGIMDFIKQYEMHIPIPLDNMMCLKILYSMTVNPSIWELNCLKDLTDYEEGNFRKMIEQYPSFSKGVIVKSWWKPGVYKYYNKNIFLFYYISKIRLKSMLFKSLE